MPYIYIPPMGRRVMRFFHLRKWCMQCNGWVGLLHVHRHSHDAHHRIC